MRKLTALFTKSLLLPAALACAFILAGCQGALTDEELKMSLLQDKSGTGLDLLADEENTTLDKSLVGTWLDFTPGSFAKPGSFMYTSYFGVTFNSDGTLYVYDSDIDEPWFQSLWDGPEKDLSWKEWGKFLYTLSETDLPKIIATSQKKGIAGTWTASHGILTVTEVDVDDKGGTYETYTDISTIKYIVSGNILTLYNQADPDDEGLYDKDGDGWEDEPEVLNKF